MTANHWTVEGEGRLAFNARRAVAGAPWCDDLIVSSPTAKQHATVGEAAFAALEALIEDVPRLKAEVRALTARLDAAHTVIRHAITHWVDHPDFPAKWTDDDWQDSGWTEAEAAEIRAATADLAPQTEDRP